MFISNTEERSTSKEIYWSVSNKNMDTKSQTKYVNQFQRTPEGSLMYLILNIK
jgi:hypothetical protein